DLCRQADEDAVKARRKPVGVRCLKGWHPGWCRTGPRQLFIGSKDLSAKQTQHFREVPSRCEVGGRIDIACKQSAEVYGEHLAQLHTGRVQLKDADADEVCQHDALDSLA